MPHSTPLSPEQQQQLADAGERAAKIRSAVKVATFNGWTLGAFAVISLMFSFSSLTALVMGLGLGWIARNEFAGKTRLMAFDRTAPAFLGKNQLALMALVVSYALFSIYRVYQEPIPNIAELEELIGPIGDLFTSLALMVYLGVIGLTVIFQGLNARFYFARTALLERYLAETPPWIVDLQRKISSQ